MHEDIIKTKEVPIVNLESLNSAFLGTLITAFCSRTPACSPAQQRLTYTHTHPYTGPQSKKIFQGKKWGMKQSEQALAIRKAGLSEQLTHWTG